MSDVTRQGNSFSIPLRESGLAVMGRQSGAGMSRLLPNIAIKGKMGAGKSLVKDFLTRYWGYQWIRFAGLHEGGLRDVVIRIWGPEYENDRTKLQLVGNEMRKIDKDCWIHSVDRLLGQYDPRPKVLDDLRYENEYYYLMGRGFTVLEVVADRGIRLNRLRDSGKLADESQLDHESETSLDHLQGDYVIVNEGTKRECDEQVERFLNDAARRHS